MSDFLIEYFSERFKLPSNEKVGLVVEKDADIICDISKCIDIIDDLLNTYEYDVSIERLGAIGELKGVINTRPTFPYSILKDTLLNEKTNLTQEEKKQIMNNLFVLKEGDETSRDELVRPIKLNIIDVFFDDSFFDDLQKNTEKTYTYTPEQKESLKSCLKVALKDINNKEIIKFTPSTLFVSLTGANGVITTLIKALLDRMNAKLQIYQSINRTNVEEEKRNERAVIKEQKRIERKERLAKIDEEREIREEEHEEMMKNDEEYRKRIEQREEKRKASDLFRKQEFKYLIEKSNKEGRIHRLAKKYDEEYNNALRNIRTDYVLDTRITDEDLRKNNEEQIKIKINDFNNKENNYLEEIKEKYKISDEINSDKVKAYAYAEDANIDVDGTELNGGKSKKTCKNRKGKKCRKTNKKQKKKSLGYRKNKGRKTRRIN
jgi:hypothetical protein